MGKSGVGRFMALFFRLVKDLVEFGEDGGGGLRWSLQGMAEC